jgi:L-fuconolactonase
MTRIDSHQHFWRYDPAQYAWITPEMQVLRRDYLPAQLKPLLEASGFDGCIAVQARQTIQETEWLLRLADENAFVRGVIGWVNLRSPTLGDQLERYSRHPKLVGVRHVVHDEPDDNFMLLPEFRAGIAQLSRFGLVYDLLLFARHLTVAIELVQEFPEQPFVLDHIAKPAIRGKELSPWDRDIRALARFQNVSCKLSGMTTEANWSQWHQQDFRVYLDIVTEAFGPKRLMIGSDWPVCTLASDYAATLGIVIGYIEPLPKMVQDDVLGGNCARIYRIK